MLKTIVAAAIGLLFGATSAWAQCTVPNTLTNGTNADATQVMANLNAILTCINSLPPPPANTPGAGFVNKLRNGTFVSWPNGISGTTATSPTGSAAIAANGWAVLPTGASVTWAQVTSGRNGAPQSLKVTGNTSVADVVIGQRIESTDAAALAGQTVTFQMAIYNSTGTSITPTLATRYAGTPDVWSSPGNDLTATSLQVCANATWCIEAYTFNASANAVNGYEIKVDFGNNFSTTGKYVQISAADLRATPGATTGPNSSPPAPELPNVAAEMARNARYFESLPYNNGLFFGAGGPNSSYGVAFSVPFTAAKRTSPTVNIGGLTWSLTNTGAPTVAQSGVSGFTLQVVPSNGWLASATAGAATAYADFW